MQEQDYDLHVTFKTSTPKNKIEDTFFNFLQTELAENQGKIEGDLHNKGKVSLYFPIEKSRTCNYYTWHLCMKKSKLDIYNESLGIRMARIQRHIKEKFRDFILRIMVIKS